MTNSIYIWRIKMDQLPPNGDNNNNQGPPGKGDPNGNERGRGRDGVREMDFIGNDIRDQGAVLVLFLMGVVSFLLRERCTC